MSDLLNKASLVVIPSGYKEDTVYSVVPSDGSGDLSFTRASNGTRVNSAGLVEVCPWNLLEYSEEFNNAAWTKQQSSITANATTAPNGTSTADKLVEDTSNSVHRMFNNSAVAVSTSDGTTYSFYLKSAGRTRAWVRDNDIVGALFNLANGTIVSTEGTATATITSAGDGWYRCTMTRVNSNGNGRISVYLDNGTSDSYTGNGTDGVFIWGAQLNIGSTAKPYFPTTDRLNVPRLTYQNGGGGCPSLLLEKQSTNLVYPSEDFSPWNLFNSATISTNTTISPDGTQNADTLNFASSAISQVFSNQGDGTNTAHTVSIYAKSSSGKKFRIKIANSTTGGDEFSSNLTTTNDWQRFDFTFTCPVTHIAICNESSGGTGTIQIWGAQLEASSYPTSYIPTTSSSATRVADACFKTGISSLIGQTSGTFFVQWINLNNDLSNLIETYNSASGITGTSSILIQKSANNQLNIRVFDSLGNYGDAFSVTMPIGTNKVALAYEPGAAIMYLNGVAIGSNSRTYVFGSTRDSIAFDNRGSYARSEVIIFPTRLTNAELASLTTI